MSDEEDYSSSSDEDYVPSGDKFWAFYLQEITYMYFLIILLSLRACVAF